ncbi:hypothetical protein F2P56_023488 [Juglans regia]|uniref:Endonuclease/exonuclease/phosphatase domain-containing protein n=1 Tax=Juglans regia TaxID=51240 RepID=A0A833UAJ0_JUGRE|nr:hypothetical protein F2P56_023488 [Juglans regia]
MKHQAWNCRGFGNPRTVCALHILVKEKSPDVVFLSETKCKRGRIKSIWDKLNFSHSFSVDCIGRNGGLAFLWNQEVDAELDSYSNYHISIAINYVIMKNRWIVTSFYGQPVTAKRRDSWDLLRLIHSKV